MNLKNLGKGAKEILSNMDFSGLGSSVVDVLMSVKPAQMAWFGIIGCACVAIGALSRQPEINKLKSENGKVASENEKLRYSVKSLNHDTGIMKNKLDALKAYQFAEKAKINAELKGCIKFQYAAKEYIEAISKNINDIGEDDKEYVEVFERILNGEEFTASEAKAIESRVIPKYQDKIENLIEFDCTTLVDQLPSA